MQTVKPTKPADNDTWLKQLYQGELYKLNPDTDSLTLADSVLQLLMNTFQVDDIYHVHDQLSEEQFFKAMKHIRKHLFAGEPFIEKLHKLFHGLGFAAGELAFEPLRLRAIRHNGHFNPRAKAVYYPHRDTWYGHDQSMVVGWLPLHHQDAHQTFEIFPDWLDQAVANNSALFNYDEWRQAGTEKKIGWQKKNTGLNALYPQAQQTVDYGQVVRFSASKAERLFFSGAHFHKTLEQVHGLTRFSVDFRFVYLKHARAKLGAINADARCQGAALQDYITLC